MESVRRFVRLFRGIAFATAIVAPGSAGAQTGVNPNLTSLAANTWVRLNPRVIDAGGNDITSIGFPINGYSGMTYDPDDHALLMYGGGGHGTWRANDVWLYDTASNTWRQQYYPDPESEYPYAEGDPSPMSFNTYCQSSDPLVCNPPSAWLPRGTTRTKRPWTGHSYDQMAYDQYNRKYFFYGPNFIFGDGVDYYGAADAFYYDVSTKVWTHMATGPNLYHQMSSFEYDPVDRLIVGTNGYSWTHPGYKSLGTPQTWVLDVTTGVWTRKGNPPRSFWDANMVWDPIDNVMLFYGGDYGASSELWSYNPRTDAWTLKAPLPDPSYGAPPAGAPYAAFDSRNGVLLIWGEGDTGYFIPTWAYNVSTNRWKKMNPQGGEPGTGAGVGAYLSYDPVNNVFFLVRYGGNDGTIGGFYGALGELWAYRYGVSSDVSAPNPVPDLRPR